MQGAVFSFFSPVLPVSINFQFFPCKQAFHFLNANLFPVASPLTFS